MSRENIMEFIKHIFFKIWDLIFKQACDLETCPLVFGLWKHSIKTQSGIL